MAAWRVGPRARQLGRRPASQCRLQARPHCTGTVPSGTMAAALPLDVRLVFTVSAQLCGQWLLFAYAVSVRALRRLACARRACAPKPGPFAAPVCRGHCPACTVHCRHGMAVCLVWRDCGRGCCAAFSGRCAASPPAAAAAAACGGRQRLSSWRRGCRSTVERRSRTRASARIVWHIFVPATGRRLSLRPSPALPRRRCGVPELFGALR